MPRTIGQPLWRDFVRATEREFNLALEHADVRDDMTHVAGPFSREAESVLVEESCDELSGPGICKRVLGDSGLEFRPGAVE